jgi:EEF1A lysine methyltransferase 4
MALAHREGKEGVTFDWFNMGMDTLRPMLEEHVPDQSARILHLGCGNSCLGEEMYAQGWRDIVNVDYAPAVIAHMRERTASSCPGMAWVVADIFALDQARMPDGTQELGLFDVALDKGTLDALLTRPHDPWDPEAEVVACIDAYMHQVWEALQPGGLFLHITWSQPHFRRRFLELGDRFDVQVQHIARAEGGFGYFCYIGRRKPLPVADAGIDANAP